MLLLKLHVYQYPLEGMSGEAATSPAMTEAFEDFAEAGLITAGVTLRKALAQDLPGKRLTRKGSRLAERLQEIEPGDFA
jgi:hypothetical protein